MSDGADGAPAGDGARPLLEIDKLTLRFRGLIAVNAVDLAVEKGQIFAVIGPNGAGKTSLFNAITGIYEPQAGTVRLEGRDLRSAPTRASYLRWAITGIVTSLLLFLWVADVNQLWAAVVKANYHGKAKGFEVDHAIEDLGAFLSGRPRIESRMGRFYVISFDGSAPFGSSRSREDAERKRAAIPALADLPADGSTIAEQKGRFAIMTEDGAEALDVAPTREAALGRLAAARTLDVQAAAAVRGRLFALLFGLALGVAGAWAVWRQTRRTPSSVAARGIARTFQNIRLFQDMTVMENVLVGMDRHLTLPGRALSLVRLRDAWPAVALAAAFAFMWLGQRAKFLPPSLVGVLLLAVLAGGVALLVSIGRRGSFSPAGAQVEATARTEATRLLEFVGLAARSNDRARNLPYGAQRRLEIARALATRPTLLLLDEPAAGMNPAETRSLMQLIKDIRGRGVTVLLIEHHMRVVMGISDRIAVLVYGAKIAEGTPEEIRNHPKVVEAYLGQEQIDPILELEQLRAGYGNIEALHGISLTVDEGEIVTLIGANGAGKTTALMAISGCVRARAGAIKFRGRDISALPTHEIVALGLVQSPEGRKIFPRLTVMENLEMGAFSRRDKNGIAADAKRVFELFPILGERRRQPGGTLSGGEQQMLAIGRAMMARPKLLLLDEPSLGLAPLVVSRIFEVIRELNREGATILLVEQNAQMALKAAHRGYVLETGTISMSGPAAELLSDQRVRSAYLGDAV